MKKSLVALAAIMCVGAAQAQYAPQSNTLGNNSTLDQQVIGDTISTADRTNSVSTQLGNSANANGAQVNPNIDTRDQNTVTSTGGAGGSATGNLSNNDNRSSVGNTSASNGPQTMGQANTGNSASNSGGNILGGATSGGNTLTNGSNTATNTANGGTGGQGGQGGAGGSVLGAGNSTNTLGQQQGIDRSGNSTVANANKSDNRNTNAQGQGQQQAATAAQGQGQQMGQGQSSNNRVSGGNQSSSLAGGNNTTRNNVGGQNASTQSGVGQSGNSTVAVDASNRSVDNSKYDGRALFIPRVTPDTPPSMLAGASVQVVADPQCGPLQEVVDTPVEGIVQGWIWDSKVSLGTTQSLIQYKDQDGNPVFFNEIILPGGKRVLGGQKLTTAYVALGVAAGKNIALGGGGSNMNWGQAGAGNTSSMQRLVAMHTLRSCVYAVEEVKTPSVSVELPVVKKTRE